MLKLVSKIEKFDSTSEMSHEELKIRNFWQSRKKKTINFFIIAHAFTLVEESIASAFEKRLVIDLIIKPEIRDSVW